MRVGFWRVVVAWMLMGAGGAALLPAQERLAAPSPLARPAAGASVGSIIVREAAAVRALEAGLPSVAAATYAELVAQPDLTPAAQTRLVLGWSMALLEGGRIAEARNALAAYAGPRDAAFQVRAGLAAIGGGDVAGARAAADAVDPDKLPAGERAWWHYLRGLIGDEVGDAAQAREAYGQAIELAGSALQRARFELANLRAQLRLRAASEADATQLARTVEQNQGRAVGYDAAKRYAAVLAALGREGEAVAFLQRQLMALPAQERQVQDDFRLVLGVIAGAADGVGRNALMNLLSSGASAEKQRLALQLLARGTTTGAAREAWRNDLSRLIALEPPHPVLPDLLVYRALLALADNRYDEALADAQAVLDRFPASPLRPAALGVLMGAAWERGRYRAVAGFATEARRLLADGEVRARLGVLIAEAFFRAGDFGNAAEAYGAALAELPPGLPPGGLMFQQVLAHIREGDLADAASRIDQLAGQPGFDAVSRWQAEYNLARALQIAGRTADAYRRVESAMAADPAAQALPADLSVRLAWLQARLALDAGQPERARQLASARPARLEEVAPALRSEVLGLLALVEAEASFALQQPETALEILRRLRSESPDTDAAVFSYIVEANAYSDRNQLVEAQRLLTRLADDFPRSRYAPYALYQAALNAERRGQDNHLADAIRLIERLVNEYPQSDLVFYARFKQGDLLRRLNQFDPAVQIYEQLVNEYPQHEDIFAAQLAQADCYAAQAAGDVSKIESALVIYERLMVLPRAPTELRVEAGFKRGNALQRRGNPDRAHAVWWEVVNTFLLGEDRGALLGGRGRYWIARALLELARSLEAVARLEEARRAYEIMAQQALPGASLANAALARLNGAPAEAGR